MGFEHLWNGWRAAYVTSGGAVGDASLAEAGDPSQSVFRRILDSGLTDDETHILHRGVTCFAILNAFPYTAGHLLVMPYRQLCDLEDLSADESSELWLTVIDAVRAVKAAYQPHGMNVGINLGAAAGGSISEHLHVHVVPRWAGDGNFMLAVAQTRTVPEALQDSAAKLRAHWPRASRSAVSSATG